MKYKLCKHCGCPVLPTGQRKKPFEYDHASGCPSEIKTGDRVRVTELDKHSRPHPHANKTGVVKHVHSYILKNCAVLIDKGQEHAGRIMMVSITCLEKL